MKEGSYGWWCATAALESDCGAPCDGRPVGKDAQYMLWAVRLLYSRRLEKVVSEAESIVAEV
jgi:hypothetical protein